MLYFYLEFRYDKNTPYYYTYLLPKNTNVIIEFIVKRKLIILKNFCKNMIFTQFIFDGHAQ